MAFVTDFSKPAAWVVKTNLPYPAKIFELHIGDKVIGGNSKAWLENYARKAGYRIANHLAGKAVK
jgi:hypothetical protein